MGVGDGAHDRESQAGAALARPGRPGPRGIGAVEASRRRPLGLAGGEPVAVIGDGESRPSRRARTPSA